MWKIIVAIAVALVLFTWWQHKWNPGVAMLEFTKGIVTTDPQVLADKAGVDLEIYSLARVGQSEEGLSSDRAKIAVMFATVIWLPQPAFRPVSTWRCGSRASCMDRHFRGRSNAPCNTTQRRLTLH